MQDEHDHSHGSNLSETELRVRAIESILVEKGYVDPKALDVLIETYETKVGPHNGAKVVAKAWNDPVYNSRLLTDATKAVAELAFTGAQCEHLIALENTEKVHNIVHALFLLSVGDSGFATGLVQVRALSLTRRYGPAFGASGLWGDLVER